MAANLTDLGPGLVIEVAPDKSVIRFGAGDLTIYGGVYGAGLIAGDKVTVTFDTAQ